VWGSKEKTAPKPKVKAQVMGPKIVMKNDKIILDFWPESCPESNEG
jgi:hypothetical protein